MRELKESLAAWIAIHQLRNENGFRRRSSSRCASRTVTTSELLRGVGMGNVRGKSARRASMGEAETISLVSFVSKAVDHTRAAGWRNGRRSVAPTRFPSLPMVSGAQHNILQVGLTVR